MGLGEKAPRSFRLLFSAPPTHRAGAADRRGIGVLRQPVWETSVGEANCVRQRPELKPVPARILDVSRLLAENHLLPATLRGTQES
jgi:hypothetical protein